MSNHYLDAALQQIVNHEVNKVLAEIRAEIEEAIPMCECEDDYCYAGGLDKALEIIDKYRKE